jgi:Rps23 Pro-64 3,4-dihydroxylase Tpa1-like proline 4-hydroxylase
MSADIAWYFTNLPEKIVEIIEEDLNILENDFVTSKLYNDLIDTTVRNSTNTWVPSNHWVSGFLWHYVDKINKENFLYDLKGVDTDSLQFTKYDVGQYYHWHQDSGLGELYKPVGTTGERNTDKLASDFVASNSSVTRKLSFVLQLSNPIDYDGGQLQLLDDANRTVYAPKHRGCMIVFDSRMRHRVKKVTRGVRKSIVGWAIGPRWR